MTTGDWKPEGGGAERRLDRKSDSELVKGLHAEETNRSPCYFWLPFTRYGSKSYILGDFGPELRPVVRKVTIDVDASSTSLPLSFFPR